MSQAGKSIEDIENEIAATRQRLAATVDELAYRAQPKQIALRQKESARAAFTSATQTPDGQLRMERIAALAVVGAVLVLIGLRARRKG